MSPGTTVVFGLIALVAIYGVVGLSLSIKRVAPGHARNVTRLPLTYARWDTEGETHRTLGPGWHLVFPGRDRVSGPIDLRDQAVSLAGLRVLTADKVGVSVDAVLSFQVADPLVAIEIGNQNEAMEDCAPRLLSDIIGRMGLDQTLASRDEISTELRERLEDASGTLGIRVSSVDVRSIEPAPEASAADSTGLLPAGLGTGPDALRAMLLQRAYEAAARRVEEPGRFSKFLDLMSAFCFKVAIPGLGIMTMSFAIPSIGPSWSAHLAHGTPGIFTATTTSGSPDCSGTCQSFIWHGTFTARDGSVVTGVRLADGGHIAALGDEEAVRYEGGRVVYPAGGGGPDWLLNTFMLIAGIAAIAYWIFLLVRLLSRRRRRLRGALGTSAGSPVSGIVP